ncbi:autotransporter outer membrane beta-barrel domain-containing protein [Escherichia coli]|nr:autotransporter outer membrane beta-barrel domain-containing protein [Escherichia coli]
MSRAPVTVRCHYHPLRSHSPERCLARLPPDLRPGYPACRPFIEANWINNSKVYAVKMNGQTVGREGARNLGEVRTGVEAKVNNNLSLWGNVGVQLGDKGYSDTQGMLGVKYSW